MANNTERFSPFLDELLNPPEDDATAPVITTPSAPPVTFEHALATGAIPTFEEQPDDKPTGKGAQNTFGTTMVHDYHRMRVRRMKTLASTITMIRLVRLSVAP